MLQWNLKYIYSLDGLKSSILQSRLFVCQKAQQIQICEALRCNVFPLIPHTYF